MATLTMARYTYYGALYLLWRAFAQQPVLGSRIGSEVGSLARTDGGGCWVISGPAVRVRVRVKGEGGVEC
eukprot:scaffold43725_cov54-Phaeocystis_antarctica.AAC.1